MADDGVKAILPTRLAFENKKNKGTNSLIMWREILPLLENRSTYLGRSRMTGDGNDQQICHATRHQ